MELKRHILVRHGRRVIAVDLPIGVDTADNVPDRIRNNARERLIRQELVARNTRIRSRKGRHEGNRHARCLMEQNAAVGVHILHIELILHARVRLPLHVVGLDTVCNGQHVLPRGIGGNRSARAVLIFRNLINDIAVTTRQHRSHLGARHTVRRTCCGKTAVAVDDNAPHIVAVAVIHLHRVVRHHKVRNFSVGR